VGGGSMASVGHAGSAAAPSGTSSASAGAAVRRSSWNRTSMVRIAALATEAQRHRGIHRERQIDVVVFSVQPLSLCASVANVLPNKSPYKVTAQTYLHIMPSAHFDLGVDVFVAGHAVIFIQVNHRT